MNIYTAFCKEADGTGTTWISSVEAETVDEAKTKAVQDCAADWGWADRPEDIACIGIVEGEISVIWWGDEA